MPEGDTLFRAATTLRKALEGARVTALHSEAPRVAASLRRRAIAGQRIVEVRASGKNLLVRFEDGRTLRSHMRMHGSWHLYREGERWQRPAFQAVAELHADNGLVAVCFSAPVIELLSPGELREQVTDRLGPDATADGFDLDEAVRRIAGLGSRTVAEALLTQSALAGVGNVLKSEVLFVCRQDPFALVRDVPADRLEQLAKESHRLLLRNRAGGPRSTRSSPGGSARLWVYGRSGEPCFVCGTEVRMRRVGFGARSTYYCPSCQNSGSAAARRSAERHPAEPRKR